MASNVAETLIGAAVLVIAGGFLLYASDRADFAGVGDGSYEVVAKFRKAEGLNTGADVRVAGVKVGSISSLTLDRQSYRAITRLAIDEGVELPEDSSAKITSEGLLGGSYVAIAPGGSEFMVEPGGELTYTQGSVSLLDLLGKAVAGGATE